MPSLLRKILRKNKTVSRVINQRFKSPFETVYVMKGRDAKDREVIFLNVPKNASTSINHCLKASRQKASETEFSGRNTLLVLRNPYKRMVSIYNEVVKQNHDSLCCDPAKFSFYQEPEVRKSFRGFLEALAAAQIDFHAIPQADCLRGLNPGQISHILLFEELAEEFPKHFGKELGFKVSGNSRIKEALKELVASDAGLRKKIFDLYRRDVTLYIEVLLYKKGVDPQEYWRKHSLDFVSCDALLTGPLRPKGLSV